jgi:hypothetical protein
MSLEISGKIVKILPEQTGSGKNGMWKKQDFVIETTEQYPKKVCISAWGDKVDALQNYSAGEDVKVSFNVESREYNEKWYTDIKVWKLESAAAGSSGNNISPKAEKQSESKSDVDTFHADSGGEDDLPF